MSGTPDTRGKSVWLYCLTDERRRVVKVGISSNVPRRALGVTTSGIAFLRRWCGFSVPARTSFSIVRTWPLGAVSRSQAEAIEALAHAALSDIAPTFANEWFHVSPRVAVPLIERAIAGRLAEAA